MTYSCYTSSDGKETYGQWLRRVPKSQLTRAEMNKLAAEAQWETANVKLVEKLDLMIGRHVRLVRDFRTFANDDFNVSVIPSLTKTQVRNPLVYPAGMSFKVHARLGQYLLARSLDGTLLQLQAKWVRLIPLPKNVHLLPRPAKVAPTQKISDFLLKIPPYSF